MSQASARQIESVRDYPTSGRQFPVLAATASLLLHALLLAVLFHAPLHAPRGAPEDRIITMRVSLPPPPEPVPAEPIVVPQPITEVSEAADSAPSQKKPATADSNANREPADREPEVAASGPDAEEPSMLRARILEQVGSAPVESDSGSEGQLPWASTGAPVPGLPGVRGWISGHIGPVQTSAQTWKENDGSSSGRYVMADGTVVCTHRRAPTIDELMNPWKSTVVTMASVCGRERPPAPDYDDPRVQPPPRAANRPAASDQ